MFSIEMLAAGHGDCLWIEYGDAAAPHRVLVDCGTAATFTKVLGPRIQQTPQRSFELLILTHIDDDHIGGGVELLKHAKALNMRFGDIWFNGWKHIKAFGHLGAEEGEQFSELLQQQGLPWNAWQKGGAIMLPTAPPTATATSARAPLPTCTLPGGMLLTLLSPDALKLGKLALTWRSVIAALGKQPGAGGFLGADAAGDDSGPVGRDTDSTDVPHLAGDDFPFSEDTAPANGSSIAVLAEYDGKSLLLGADVHPKLLAASVRQLLRERRKNPDHGDRLQVDVCKLPHHGSQNNVDKPLLDLLDCRHVLVSTDGSVFRHPDRQAIARVIQHSGPRRPTLWFNYNEPKRPINRVWMDAALQKRYGFDAKYPQPGHPGIAIRL